MQPLPSRVRAAWVLNLAVHPVDVAMLDTVVSNGGCRLHTVCFGFVGGFYMPGYLTHQSRFSCRL